MAVSVVSALLDAPEIEVDRGIIEVASWRLVSELHRRFPGRFSIIEMHPGGGTYDCLALYNSEDDVYCMFNRPGSFAIQCPLAGPEPDKLVYPIWPYMVTAGSRAAVDEVMRLLGETPPTKLPASTRATLTYRVMASMIQIAASSETAWQWRNGQIDSSGPAGSGPDQSYFEPFDRLAERRVENRLHDPFGVPEYRFWFLVPKVGGEPVIALETTGMAYLTGGRVVDLKSTYAQYGRSPQKVAGQVLTEIDV